MTDLTAVTQDPVVEVQDLVIKYHNKTAVNGINFSVQRGECLGVLGGNGAGKSSTLKVLGGVLLHTDGSVRVNGVEITDFKSADYARSIVGYSPDVGGLIPQATLREHIGVSLSMRRKLDRMESALSFVEMFRMQDALDLPANSFSHGMSRRASVILAVIGSKDLVILDEPFDGVDPVGVEAVRETIKMATSRGVSVIVSTHLQQTLAEATDRIMVMSQGQVLAQEPSDNFLGADGVNYYQKLLKDSLA